MASDDDPDVDLAALRERVDELEARVDALEAGGGDVPEPDADGLDQFDEAVLRVVREQGDPGPRGTVRAYLRLTKISDRSTAKRRAKLLRGHPAFEEAVDDG